MSTTGDILSVIKKLLLVSEDLTRLNAEIKELSSTVQEHGERLVRVETIISMSGKQNRIVLPGS